MTTRTVFIGLGANLGDRSAMFNAAARSLAGLPSTRLVWCSSVYETEPVGVSEQPPFLNAAVELETALTPPEMLRALKDLEVSLGRRERERWGPREIDIDILLYDGVLYSDETVTVPHPELEHRRFVLVPLRDVAPDLVHPVSGLTITERSGPITRSIPGDPFVSVVI